MLLQYIKNKYILMHVVNSGEGKAEFAAAIRAVQFGENI